jgi:hypothetical protein
MIISNLDTKWFLALELRQSADKLTSVKSEWFTPNPEYNI